MGETLKLVCHAPLTIAAETGPVGASQGLCQTCQGKFSQQMLLKVCEKPIKMEITIKNKQCNNLDSKRTNFSMKGENKEKI